MITQPISNHQNVSFKGQVSYQDYKNFQLLHSKNKMLYQIVYLFVIFMAVVFYTSSFDTTLLPVFIPIGILVSLAIALVSKLFMNMKYQSVFKTDKLLQKEYLYTLDKEGIRTDSEVGNGKFKWEEVYQVKQNKKLHLIYVAKNKALIIPRSFFEDVEQIKKFESLLSTNLSDKQYQQR